MIFLERNPSQGSMSSHKCQRDARLQNRLHFRVGPPLVVVLDRESDEDSKEHDGEEEKGRKREAGQAKAKRMTQKMKRGKGRTNGVSENEEEKGVSWLAALGPYAVGCVSCAAVADLCHYHRSSVTDLC
jgi:hypothetical protein